MSAARLHVLLAPEAPVAVIIRRGPSDWFRLSRWQTDTGSITHGLWFRGKIFPLRSDLSPDGTWLLYFAAKYSGAQGRFGLDYCDAWTALSHPPDFTAQTLWPSLSGVWLGGGLFEGARRLLLNFGAECAAPHADFPLPDGLTTMPLPRRLAGDMPLYARRLERDGWVLQPAGAFAAMNWQWGADWRWGKALRWHKASGGHTLVMEWYNGDFIYALDDPTGEILLEGCTWADWDQGGRLVAAHDGRLVFINPAAPHAAPHLIEDFNGQRPAAR